MEWCFTPIILTIFLLVKNSCLKGFKEALATGWNDLSVLLSCSISRSLFKGHVEYWRLIKSLISWKEMKPFPGTDVKIGGSADRAAFCSSACPDHQHKEVLRKAENDLCRSSTIGIRGFKRAISVWLLLCKCLCQQACKHPQKLFTVLEWEALFSCIFISPVITSFGAASIGKCPLCNWLEWSWSCVH